VPRRKRSLASLADGGLSGEEVIMTQQMTIMAHADAIAAVVLTVCAVLLAVLAVAEKARKDNPTW